MEIPLKGKYKCHKTVKACKSSGGQNKPKKHKVAGKKSYKYAQRVMIVDAGSGRKWMVDGEIG